MIEIEKPRIECIETPSDEAYGKFVVEPLERGYGTTLGNSLRRVLLSSLPGTAVTRIKIAGIQHEFSTIPGITEDVTEIVLNVKGIIACLHSEGPKTVYIEASGEGEVTAGDIKADSEVEILNPEHHLATLGPDASLSMELTVDHGRGYVTAEHNKLPTPVIGTIPVDSIFSPVLKVNYTVENTRVGNQGRCLHGRGDPVRALLPVHGPVGNTGKPISCGGTARATSGSGPGDDHRGARSLRPQL